MVDGYKCVSQPHVASTKYLSAINLRSEEGQLAHSFLATLADLELA